MNKRQKRKKYKKAAKIRKDLFYAYNLARKLNQQCAGCSSDYHHFRKTNLKRCLTYHKWCLKHGKKLSELYYSNQNKNKRRYSPELVFNAMENFKENHKFIGELSRPISGLADIKYEQSCVITLNSSPRFEVNDDGSMKVVTSFELVKEDNHE